MSTRNCLAVGVLASDSGSVTEFLSPESQLPDVSSDTLTNQPFYPLF